MNDLFLICEDCKIYIDVGYRWAYWTLEKTGIVSKNEKVNPQKIFQAKEYWNPEEKGSDWLLDEVLPSINKFLRDHENHSILYGEFDDFIKVYDETIFEWKNIGYNPDELPRLWVEDLGLKNWNEVINRLSKPTDQPWFWDDGNLRNKATIYFNNLLKI